MRQTVLSAIVVVCIFVCGGLSWMLLLGILAGKLLAAIGFVYGITISLPAAYFGGIVSGKERE